MIKRIVTFLFLTCCVMFLYAQDTSSDTIPQLTVIKKNLVLDDNDLKQFESNDTIVSALYLTIIDSVKVEKIKRRLDSFLMKKYDSKKLITALKLERKFKGQQGSFELSDTISRTNALEFKSAEEFLKWREKLQDSLFKNMNVESERKN